MLLLIGLADALFTKVMVEDPRAKCLDGSQPPLYLDDTGYQDTLIYFQGGGTCILPTMSLALQACLERSSTLLGSSKYEPQSYSRMNDLLQIFSNDSQVNPTFYRHRKVFIRYCDGTIHQGFRNSSFRVDGTELFIRGSANTLAVLAYLQKLGWLKGNVTVSGTSAGGVAVGLWADNITRRVGGKATAVVDSGLFFPLSGNAGPLLDQAYQNMFNFTNEVQSYFPKGSCPNYTCYFPESLFRGLAARTLILNSNYDEWNILNALQVLCVHNHSFRNCLQADLTLAASYYQASKAAIASWPHSFWTISCLYHGIFSSDVFGKSEYRPNLNGPTAREALHRWYSEEAMVRVDDRQQWPGNSPCAYSAGDSAAFI